jgi:Zn-dependent membrane protease YugP
MAALRESGNYSEEELCAARKVLTAAAMTYVGALAVSMLQFLRLLSMARRR